MLLADGQNDCGDIRQALVALQGSGVIFRHETVGLGITPNSGAAQDLRQIATRTGGAYHHAAASQFSDVFMEFVDTLTVIDMLGAFGQRTQAAPGGSHAREREPGKPGTGWQRGPVQHDRRNPGEAVGERRDDRGVGNTPSSGGLRCRGNDGWHWAARYRTGVHVELRNGMERRLRPRCGNRGRECVPQKFREYVLGGGFFHEGRMRGNGRGHLA